MALEKQNRSGPQWSWSSSQRRVAPANRLWEAAAGRRRASACPVATARPALLPGAGLADQTVPVEPGHGRAVGLLRKACANPSFPGAGGSVASHSHLLPLSSSSCKSRCPLGTRPDLPSHGRRLLGDFTSAGPLGKKENWWWLKPDSALRL